MCVFVFVDGVQAGGVSFGGLGMLLTGMLAIVFYRFSLGEGGDVQGFWDRRNRILGFVSVQSYDSCLVFSLIDVFWFVMCLVL